MDNIPEIILGLGLILIFSKIFGEIFHKLSLPPLFGEILVGIIIGTLGIASINESSELSLGNFITVLAQIGIIFLLFRIGFEEIETKNFSKIVIGVLPIEIIGIIFPFLGGFIACYFFADNLFTDSFKGALLVGTALAATSLGVSVRTLMDLKYISTKPGMAIVTVGVVDGFIGLIFFAIIYGIIQYDTISLEDIKDILLLFLLFFIFIYIFGRFIVWRIAKIVSEMTVEESVFAIIIGLLFIFSFLSDKIGASVLIGAFILGFALSKVPQFKTSETIQKIKGISYGFFIPFFFVYIGMLFKFEALTDINILIFGFLLLTFLILFQIVGAFIGAKISKFDNKDSLIISVGMLPRNEIMLIVGMIGLELSLYKGDIFSAFILISIFTTIITPLILRMIIKR
ncbi:MAG: cation:proton antiporter [Candidatus Altarchaeaceae archaeon]